MLQRLLLDYLFPTPDGDSLFCDSWSTAGKMQQGFCFRPLTGIHCSVTFWLRGSTKRMLRFRPLTGIHCSVTLDLYGVKWNAYWFPTPDGDSLFCDYEQQKNYRDVRIRFRPLTGIHCSVTPEIHGLEGWTTKFPTPDGDSLFCDLVPCVCTKPM